MASTADILAKEELLEPLIYLHREGIFWKAYQYSAYRVLQRQPNLKLKKKFVKAVSCEVISLGFPDVTLERIFDKREIRILDEKLLCITDRDLDRQSYERWFEAVALMESPYKLEFSPKHPIKGCEESVLCKLREFRIEESTPMSCMNFLVSLRKELIEYGHI